jgi:hypothetical protein
MRIETVVRIVQVVLKVQLPQTFTLIIGMTQTLIALYPLVLSTLYRLADDSDESESCTDYSKDSGSDCQTDGDGSFTLLVQRVTQAPTAGGKYIATINFHNFSKKFKCLNTS